MADVKWIKITTDIFDDEKILMIESMPAADSIIVIWFKLLALAGKQNNNGVFMMSNRIAYTDEMLATIFRREVNVVRLAIDVFQKFGMVEIVESVITIPNWGKHQSLDAYEKKKERDRERIARKRAEQKVLALMSPDLSHDKSPDVASLDKEEEKEVEEEKESKGRAKRFTPPTLEEVEAYCRERGNRVDPERFLDYYTSNGWKVGKNPMKDWKATVRTWEKSDKQTGRKDNGFQTSNPFLEMLQEERGL